MRFVCLLLLICLGLGSCQPVMLTLYGIRKPHPVADTFIEKKAASLGLDTCHLLCIRPEYYPGVLRELGTLPNIRIYDKTGRPIRYSDGPDACKATAEVFIRNLRPDMPGAPFCDSTDFDFSAALRHLHGEEFAGAPDADTDFTVFVFWGTFLGRLNKDYVTNWATTLRDHPYARFRVWYVSTDLPSAWGSDGSKQREPEPVGK